jgi:hypothetical protein
MEHEHDTANDPAQCAPGYREIEITAYVGDHRIVGTAHFGVDQRASSRRASDFIRSIDDSRLTLSRVRIHHKDTRELVDTTPFIVLNMDKVDFMYGRDEDPCEEPK